MRIHYTEQKHYEFAVEFLKLSESNHYSFQLYPESLDLESSDLVLGQLLQRIGNPQYSVILPNLKDQRWLITALTLQQLDQTLARIRHFLVPTYATLSGGEDGSKQSLPRRSYFKNGDTKYHLQQLGAELYPIGYYVLQSNAEYTEQVLSRLGLWLRLEADSTTSRHIEKRLTYGMLYERFKSALVAAQWTEAETALEQIKSSNLTTADNLLFLTIELLAHQQRWQDIGDLKDFQLLTRMQIPRAVRGALLTAFHQKYLLPSEEKGAWLEGLDIFRDNQPALGLLLTGRLGLRQSPVVQIYAYQAANEQDRVSLLQLNKEDQSQETQKCITALLHWLNQEEQKKQGENEKNVSRAMELAREALNNSVYDQAKQHAEMIEHTVEKTIILLLVAFYTFDAKYAEDALLSFWDLSISEQEYLQNRYPYIQLIVDTAKKLVEAPDALLQKPDSLAELQQTAIYNWLEWFAEVKRQPDNPELLLSLGRLANVTDDRFWTDENITKLNDQLFDLVASESAIIKLPAVRDALQKIVQSFLSDTDFPRTERVYQQLYDTLYAAMLYENADNELSAAFILLRLAEALLRHAPGKRETILQNLHEWSGDHPIPKLELWVLEVFDLLISYGLEPGQLSDWYSSWLSQLQSQRHYERTNLEGWREFGKIIQPGRNLTDWIEQPLRKSLQEEISSPIEKLRPGYQIGIYSLLESAAERAKSLLLARNPQIEVRVCTEEVFSDSAKALAERSDLVVLVTTAITHTLSYGIGPLIKSKDVVYPQSGGSTGILRAIEAYLSAREKSM